MTLNRCILALSVAAAVGCGSKPRLYMASRFALGPVAVTIQVVATDKDDAERAVNAAFDAISRVNDLMSCHIGASEISRLNSSGTDGSPVSPETAFVLRRAIEVSEQSGGAFDVTAGPLIRLWKRTIETGELPPPDELAAARERVGYRKLRVEPAFARFETEGMSVDLGGIAKGYAVDRAIEALKAHGIRDALVDAGGDGYALGARPDGAPWRAGIQNPRKMEGARLPEVLLLSNKGYATSGDYAQYVEIEGVRYAHIVDPRTGQPARAAASVTVVAADSTTADALATAISVLGPEEGVALAERTPGVECMVITESSDGLKTRASAGFAALTAR